MSDFVLALEHAELLLNEKNAEIRRLQAENERLHRELTRQGEVCDRLLKQADAENERLRAENIRDILLTTVKSRSSGYRKPLEDERSGLLQLLRRLHGMLVNSRDAGEMPSYEIVTRFILQIERTIGLPYHGPIG